jgi:TolB-like protein/DNA-binding SARP family transcriptional activator
VFSLKLFGGASIHSPTGPIEGRAVQRRRLGLLALLAAPRHTGMGPPATGVSRERLVSYLWPEAASDRGRHLLSDSVYRVNQALGGEAIAAAGDELRVNATILPSDVAQLEDAAARGDHQRVVSLYAGPFLDGVFLADSTEFERWVDSTRDRFARHYAASLETLAVEAEHAGDPTRAVDWWRLLATHDPLNARIALRFMEALDATGARASALRHADIHAALLRAELGAEPDTNVVALVERLRSTPPAILPVSPPVERRATTPAPPLPSPSVARHRRRWPAGLAFAAATIGLLAVLSARAKRIDGPSSESFGPSIGVLPFTDVSEQHDNEYFGDGMTEELINTLAKVPDVHVASRTSAFVYKGRALDVREVGRRLGVATVLEGSVRKSGSKLRITARLVSAEDGYQLWSEAFERRSTDVFAVQEEIAAAIVRKVRDRVYLRGQLASHER